MKKNIAIVVGIIAIAILGFVALSEKTTKTNEVVNNVPKTQTEAPSSEAQVSEQPPTQEEVAAITGSYEAYSAEKIALAATDDVVIFFHASWCPSCRSLNSDIEKNVEAIPAGVTILKIDYDKETALKKKYGVTHQHTLVQVDKDGNLITKWSGGSRLEDLLSQIQ